MKESIASEKGIYGFRLTMIGNWALQRLKEIRLSSDSTNQKLNEWIDVAFKAETDAILELEKVIKTAIEKETKLQYELGIKYMDFYLDEKILYFRDPPPPVYPAGEEIRPDGFTIDQLKTIIGEIGFNSVDDEIKCDTLINILVAGT